MPLHHNLNLRWASVRPPKADTKLIVVLLPAITGRAFDWIEIAKVAQFGSRIEHIELALDNALECSPSRRANAVAEESLDPRFGKASDHWPPCGTDHISVEANEKRPLFSAPHSTLRDLAQATFKR
jgi:hypothetical protein